MGDSPWPRPSKARTACEEGVTLASQWRVTRSHRAHGRAEIGDCMDACAQHSNVTGRLSTHDWAESVTQPRLIPLNTVTANGFVYQPPLLAPASGTPSGGDARLVLFQVYHEASCCGSYPQSKGAGVVKRAHDRDPA